MKLKEFENYSEEERIHVLYRDGVYIGKRKANNVVVVLYQVDSFYIEIFYKIYRLHILRMSCSASTSVLDPYLEQISFKHLVD